MTTYRVIGHNFSSSLSVEEDTIVSAEDLLDWSIGRPWHWLRGYCEKKQWAVQPLVESPARVVQVEYGHTVYEFHWVKERCIRITRHVDGQEAEDVTALELPDEVQEMIE